MNSMFPGFTSVEVSSTCSLTIVYGSEYSAVVTCDDNLEPYLIVEESGDKLTVGLMPFTSYNHITFGAVVTMPELDGVSLSGASYADVSGFVLTDDLSVNLSEASEIYLELPSTASGLNASVTDASRIETFFHGTGIGPLNLVCSGASTASMWNGYAASAVVDLSGASNANIQTGGTISGTVTEASYLACNFGADTSNLSIDFASGLEKY